MLLPSCFNLEKKGSLSSKNIPLSEDDELLLQDLCEVIIPESDTPGAKKLGLHLFVLKMVNECRPERERQSFIEGLQEFRLATEDRLKRQFIQSADSEKEAILEDLESQKFGGNIASFYNTLKQELVKGYINSEYFMTEIRPYKLVPGGYEPRVKIG